MEKKEKFLAICDKPSQITQLLAYEKILTEVGFANFGENLIVVVLDSLGNNHTAQDAIKNELKANYLFNAQVIKYEASDLIYQGNYSKPEGLREITAFIRNRINAPIKTIFCALLSQRFVKIHLDAYPKASIYLLEDGLASYLEIPVKDCQSWGAYYTHGGIVSAHLERLQRTIFNQVEAGIPKCYLQSQKFNLNLATHTIEPRQSLEEVHLGLNAECKNIIDEMMKNYWHIKAQQTMISDSQVVVIGQNLSDFCKDFFFRNELELYVDICEKLLEKFDNIIFVPHPKASARMATLMQGLLKNPERVQFFSNPDVPVESLFLMSNPPKYAVGLYSSSMWNLSNILGVKNVYTALGWETIKLYQELSHDIQKQAYKKARQEFYHIGKLLGEVA